MAILFSFVAFFHVSVMSFAMGGNMDGNMNGNIINNLNINHIQENKNKNFKKGCNHSCCFVKNIDTEKISFFGNKNNLEKFSNIKNFFYIPKKKFLQNKKILKNFSPPPIFSRKISNYSYSDLIKIIKSNT